MSTPGLTALLCILIWNLVTLICCLPCLIRSFDNLLDNLHPNCTCSCPLTSLTEGRSVRDFTQAAPSKKKPFLTCTLATFLRRWSLVTRKGTTFAHDSWRLMSTLQCGVMSMAACGAASSSFTHDLFQHMPHKIVTSCLPPLVKTCTAQLSVPVNDGCSLDFWLMLERPVCLER